MEPDLRIISNDLDQIARESLSAELDDSDRCRSGCGGIVTPKCPLQSLETNRITSSRHHSRCSDGDESVIRIHGTAEELIAALDSLSMSERLDTSQSESALAAKKVRFDEAAQSLPFSRKTQRTEGAGTYPLLLLTAEHHGLQELCLIVTQFAV